MRCGAGDEWEMEAKRAAMDREKMLLFTRRKLEVERWLKR